MNNSSLLRNGDPVHLLRILRAPKMKARSVEATPMSNQQMNLFDSQ